jgi:hypothetical protein
MTTPTPLARGKRHNIASIALDHYRSGQSERDALDNAIAGKSINAADREAIEIELRGMIDGAASDRAELAPGLAVVPDGAMAELGSRVRAGVIGDREAALAATVIAAGGPIVPPPGALEHDAAVERIAAGSSERAKGQRRSPVERLVDALEDFSAARDEVRRFALGLLAERFAAEPATMKHARMMRAAISENLIDDAIDWAGRAVEVFPAFKPGDFRTLAVLVVDTLRPHLGDGCYAVAGLLAGGES